MSSFTVKKWDVFLREKHTNFYDAFTDLQTELEQAILEFLSSEEHDATALDELAQSLEKWIEIYISIDSYQRGERYNLPIVPYTSTIAQFLSLARQKHAYTSGLMGRYWQHNNQLPRTEKKRG